MRKFPSRKRRASLSQLGSCGMGSSPVHAPNPPAIRLEPRRGSVMQPRRGRAATSPGSCAHHNGSLAAADPSGVPSGFGDTFQHDGTPAGFAVHRIGGRSTPQGSPRCARHPWAACRKPGGLVVGNPRNPRGSLGTRRPTPPPAETTAPTQRRPTIHLRCYFLRPAVVHLRPSATSAVPLLRNLRTCWAWGYDRTRWQCGAEAPQSRALRAVGGVPIPSPALRFFLLCGARSDEVDQECPRSPQHGALGQSALPWVLSVSSVGSSRLRSETARYCTLG